MILNQIQKMKKSNLIKINQTRIQRNILREIKKITNKDQKCDLNKKRPKPQKH